VVDFALTEQKDLLSEEQETSEKTETPETSVAGESEVKIEVTVEKVADKDQVAVEKPVESDAHDGDDSDGDHRRGDRGGDRGDRRYGGRGRSPRGDRPMTNEEKLRAYKRQSEDRLLDIKRSKENKIGKKRKR